MTVHRRRRDTALTPSKARTRTFHGDGPDTKPKTSDEKLLALAKARFQLAQEADDKQRTRELDDLRFYAGDQWPGDLITARAGIAAIGDMPPVPARPCLVINKTLQPVAQILNQERAMDMGAELIPADDFEGLIGPIDDTEVELREGLLRRIQRAPETADARTWAFERAAIAGRGYWGVMTKFVSGKTWDQDVYTKRFLNQASVTLDPAHEQPDGSDAEWGFVGSYLPWEQYKAEFPAVAGKDNAVLLDGEDDEDFRALGESHPGWFQYKTTVDRDGNDVDTKLRVCRVVEYYYTARTVRTLCLMDDGSSVWKDELPDGAKPTSTRDVIEKSIKWVKLDGRQILERTDWPGPDIPIIKVMGRELQPYDDDRRAEGIVRPMRDSGQALNYIVSKAMEMTVGLPPMAQWMVPAGGDEGFEGEWDLSNTRTIGRLHYNTKDATGLNDLPPPQRIDNGPVGVEPMFNAIGLFSQFIQDTTLTPQAALGNVDPAHKSGKAIQAVIEQSQRGTSNFLDNQARSIRREGQILNGLLYPIYGLRPGRLARIMTGEGDTQTVLIGQPFQHDEHGRPQPLHGPAGPDGQPSAFQGPLPQNAKHYQLTPDANFNIVVKVSKSYDTRREQENEMLGRLIEANPNEMAITGDLFFESMDGPGAKQAAERHKLVLAPPILAHLQQKKDGGTANPQIQQLQAQIHGMTQQLQQFQSGIAVEQMKIQSNEKIATQKDATTRYLGELQVQATIQTTQAKINADMAEASIEAETKKIAAVLDEKVGVMQHLTGMAHDAGTQAADQQHASLTQVLDHAHERSLAAQQAVHQQDAAAQQQQGASDLAAQQASHQQDAQAQQAALQPPQESQ